jgi:hypothetical protein
MDVVNSYNERFNHRLAEEKYDLVMYLKSL